MIGSFIRCQPAAHELNYVPVAWAGNGIGRFVNDIFFWGFADDILALAMVLVPIFEKQCWNGAFRSIAAGTKVHSALGRQAALDAGFAHPA